MYFWGIWGFSEAWAMHTWTRINSFFWLQILKFSFSCFYSCWQMKYGDGFKKSYTVYGYVIRKMWWWWCVFRKNIYVGTDWTENVLWKALLWRCNGSCALLSDAEIAVITVPYRDDPHPPSRGAEISHHQADTLDLAWMGQLDSSQFSCTVFNGKWLVPFYRCTLSFCSFLSASAGGSNTFVVSAAWK